jgi:hypothetical protein
VRCHSERPHREEPAARCHSERSYREEPASAFFLSIGKNYTIAPIPMKLHRKYIWLTCPIYPLLYDIIET